MSGAITPQPRVFRYSLRGLLVLVTLASFAMAWVHSARRQHVAVEALRASNLSVTVAYQGDSGDSLAAHLRRSLRRLVGDDYAATATNVELCYATDADLECLAQLPDVRTVSLVRSIDVTDAGLAHLARLRAIETLSISDGLQITDAGVRQLARLTTLRRLVLDLGRHRVSRGAIESLREALPKCQIEMCDSGVRAELAAAVTTSSRSVRQSADRRCPL